MKVPHQALNASRSEPALSRAPVTGRKTCSPTPAGSKARAAGAVKVCVETTPTPAGSRAQTTAAAAGCDVAAGHYGHNRHMYCLNDLRRTYTLLGTDGAVKGVGEISLNTHATLGAHSASWNETITATVTRLDEHVNSLTIALEASCDNACAMINKNPWSNTTTLSAVGQSVSGTVTYRVALAAGERSMVTPKAVLKLYQAGDVPGDFDHGLSLPWPARCDAEFSTVGCVFPQTRPAVQMSLAAYGAATVTYWYARDYLSDHWGAPDSPLQRLASDSAATRNRRLTCEDLSSIPFVPFADIPEDSCDEYPFAHTYQGGTDGGRCAEIIPKFEDGEWWIYVIIGREPTGYEPCVRGHVPLTQNKAAGGKYGNFVQNERVLDLEKFTVTITQ
ncbi:NucA/NucB deoxyribonuclease domain-containing protein [Thermomonospora umbrina]|nr:hypothetical protein [Thermomonospora umbrina]